MDLDPILSALSKLEQSINDRYNDLNDRYNDLNNKITNLDEKVESILSIANDLHTTSPTVNDAAPDTPKRTK
jgi:prefoldin subunit 5